MEFSPTLGAIAAALAKAQSEITGAKKDSVNPFFKANYANLESVWEAIKIPLSKNGLTVVQGFTQDEKALLVESRLIHSSGEWIHSTLRLPILKQDPQSIGSLASYGRRYNLTALVGVYQEDNDAEQAMDRKVQQSAPQDTAPKVSQSANVSTAQVVKAPAQVQSTSPGKIAPVLKQPIHQAPITFSPTAGSGITTEQIGSINTLVAGLGLSQDELRDLSVRLFNVSLIRSLSKPQGDILARELRAMSEPSAFQKHAQEFQKTMTDSDIPF